MARTLRTMNVARFALVAAAVLAAWVGSGQAASAQNRTQDVRIGIGPISIDIGEPDWGRPGPRPPRPQPRVEYVVSEYNPITGGVYRTQRFATRSQANLYRDSLARAHWVKWRFVGINEPIRFQRFNSVTAAQHFIANDGPSKSGKLGFALLENKTRAVPTRTTLSTQRTSLAQQ